MMLKKKPWYFSFAIVIGIIIYLAGVYQLPMYSGRLILISLLAFIDILFWLIVRNHILRYHKILKFIFWLPLFSLLSFFLVGLIVPYEQWRPFFRIYIPGVLMVLLIGKGVFLICSFLGFLLQKIYIIIKKTLHSKYLIVKKTGLRIILGFAASISGAIIIIFFSGMIFWVNNFKLSEVEITLEELPAEFNEYRIIQISDLHLGSYISSRSLKAMIQLIDIQKPDLILFTGDIVNFTTDEVYPFEKTISQLKAKDGIYAVLGNHDYGEYSQWKSEQARVNNNLALHSFYKRIGWQLLRNQNSIITKDSASVAIVGVENWSLSKRFGKKGDITKALKGCERIPVKILLSHDPSHWDGEINWKFPEIRLTLSGHTHAFQFAIETGGVKWSPASLLYKQWGGLYEKKGSAKNVQYLYVNRGAGTLGYPGRILTRPEITLIKLKCGKE